MRVTSVVLLTILGTACTVGEEYVPSRGDETASLVLGGSDLDHELSASPSHKAPFVFRRVGVMFDSDRPGAIEVATSTDGATWGAWQAADLRNVEVGSRGSFVGEVAVDGEARYFRLRGAGVTWARIDTLVGVGDEWEGNDTDDVDGAALAPSVTLTGVTVRTRADWGARAASCTSTHTPKKLTVHHTDTPNNDTLSVPARLRQIQSYHRDVRGWCDIGYHFLISPDGQIWEGRPINRLGAHTAGANTNNVGISLIGSFETVPPSAAQLAATSALIKAIAGQYAITISRTTVKGHREQGTTSTDCPGAKTFALLGSIVDNAKSTNPPPPPPPTQTTLIEGVIYEGNDPSARVAGATVTIGGKSATTSATGTYSIDGLAPGIYEVKVTKAGYDPVTFTRDTKASASISASISKTQAAGTAVLQGVVYRGTNGLDRIPYANVTFSNGRTITTDGNGYYIVSAMPPGNITITATATGYAANSVSRTLVNGQSEWGSVSLK